MKLISLLNCYVTKVFWCRSYSCYLFTHLKVLVFCFFTFLLGTESCEHFTLSDKVNFCWVFCVESGLVCSLGSIVVNNCFL